MNAKLLCFGAASVALLGALFGCGGQLSSSLSTKQGTSEWVSPSDSKPAMGVPPSSQAPSSPPSEKNPRHSKSMPLNMQQVAKDLDLLVDPPSDSAEHPPRHIIKRKIISSPITAQPVEDSSKTEFHFFSPGVILKVSQQSDNAVVEFSGESCELSKDQLFDENNTFLFEQDELFLQFLSEKCQWDLKRL